VFIRKLHVKNLKLLRDFELEFTRADGSARMWTVIIGENGTGKTTILQAIAMAAAGSSFVNLLANRVTKQLVDRRGHGPMEIVADFGFQVPPSNATRVYPGREGRTDGVTLVSAVRVAEGESALRASATYSDGTGGEDPLVVARSRNLHL
jgi:DNA repair ATPase RecN